MTPRDATPSSERPRLGQAVTLERTLASGRKVILDGVVERVEQYRFALAVPPTQEQAPEPRPAEQVRVRYSDGRGLRYFTAKVLQVEPSQDGGLRVFVTQPPLEQQQQVQRRRFMRLALQVAVHCVRLDAEDEPVEECQAQTLEVGGNGAGLVADRAFKVGERVRFALDLGEEFGACGGTGTVKRSVLALTPGGRPEHRVALQFTEIDSKSQARILSFLLAARRTGDAP